MIEVVKDNPCTRCVIKELYGQCEDKCIQYRKWYQYQQGRVDAIENMYVSIIMSLENIRNGADITKEFEWIHQFDEQLKEKA